MSESERERLSEIEKLSEIERLSEKERERLSEIFCYLFGI